jgi:hypothetical protein
MEMLQEWKLICKNHPFVSMVWRLMFNKGYYWTSLLEWLTSKRIFKYLGFLLKPNKYGKRDWSWLLERIEARINHWSNRWLSLVVV